MADESDLALLDPVKVRLLSIAGIPRMTFVDDRSYFRVRVARAFPISNPSRYYAVLDGDGKDIGIIADPAGLDAESRAVADAALEERYFVPVVQSVNEVSEDYGAIIWDV